MLERLDAFVEPMSYGQEMMVRFMIIFICWGIVLSLFFKITTYLHRDVRNDEKKQVEEINSVISSQKQWENDQTK